MATRTIACGGGVARRLAFAPPPLVAGSLAFAAHVLVAGSYTSRRWSRVSTQSLWSITVANTQCMAERQFGMVVPPDGIEARVVQRSVVGSYASSRQVFTKAPVESWPPTK